LCPAVSIFSTIIELCPVNVNSPGVLVPN
jgi:hypothetical protein